MSYSLPPDTLNSIGVLTRREVEARILVPLIGAFSTEFGQERVLEILRHTIIQIARQQGAALAESIGGNDLEHFVRSLEAWRKGDAMHIEVLAQDQKRFFFNVKRCRYAEMYQALGIPKLGLILSCSRDHALIEGFNPSIHLERSQTILEGADYCDFRYTCPVFA